MHKLIKRMTAVVLCVVTVFCSCGAAVYAEPDSRGIFRCDWFDESIYYPYEYSDEWFGGKASDYNHELATFALCASLASFNSFNDKDVDENIEKLFKECGYDIHSYGYETEGYDTVGLAVGAKDAVIDGVTYTLTLAIIRSGNYYMEWGGNLRVGSGETHKGFDLAKATVIGYLNEYFSEHKPEHEVKLLTSGYSRGASIANLFAAELDDGRYASSVGGKNYIAEAELSKENIYAYTYEAPQCTKDKNAHAEAYNNIFNIVNPNDYVPMFVMDEWGFTHYGRRLELPGADNCAEYDDYYKRVCAEFDSYMGKSGKKAKDCFYDKESSKSAQVTWKYIFSGLGSDVMKSQEYYAENYEEALVFFAGQYLGKKRNISDIAKTAGFALIATVLVLTPENLEKVRTAGFRNYLAKEIADSASSTQLSEKQIKNTIDILIKLLEFLGKNRKAVISLAGQMKTLIYVHQPYVNMAWMRTVTGKELLNLNKDMAAPINISFTSVDVKCGSKAKIHVEHVEGTVKWSAADESIVKVSGDGTILGVSGGVTAVTATLCDENGKEIGKDSVNVTVYCSPIQMLFQFFDRFK